MEKNNIAKRFSNLILLTVCWIGVVLALLFIGLCIFLATTPRFGDLDAPHWRLEDMLLLSYVVALFLFIILTAISAFRIYYLHHQPTHRLANLRIILSILTAITAAPSLFYLVKMLIVAVPTGTSIAFTFLTSIAIYAISCYVFGKTFLCLSQRENNH